MNKQCVPSIAECNSTVIHRVIGSTLAAESAALATALDRQLDVRLWLDSILFGERQGWC